MGILQARPKLQPGETLRWKTLANRVLSPAVTSGGRLVVTDRRVFFQPNRYDAMLGKELWECPLDAVTGIEVVGRDAAVLAAGMRKRLGIRTADGLEVFVVNRLKGKVPELRGLLPRAGVPDGSETGPSLG
jgi:hypothetical protein